MSIVALAQTVAQKNCIGVSQFSFLSLTFSEKKHHFFIVCNQKKKRFTKQSIKCFLIQGIEFNNQNK